MQKPGNDAGNNRRPAAGHDWQGVLIVVLLPIAMLLVGGLVLAGALKGWLGVGGRQMVTAEQTLQVAPCVTA